MLVNHEIDVASVTRAFSRESNIIDRSTHIRAQGGDWSKVKPLFPDRMAEAARFIKQHGYVPANHAYAIRGDVDRKYPWLAFNLYKAFVSAKQVYRRLSESLPSGCFRPRISRQNKEILGDDRFTAQGEPADGNSSISST